MELYQLRSFAAVAELGHLTRAAERLHISQPAVSAQIKALEDELGVSLFERVSSGMVLTSAGRKLLPAAEKVLDAAQALRSRASALQGRGRRDAYASARFPIREFTRVGEFLAKALETHPLLEIEIHHEVTRRCIREGARRRARRKLLLRQASSIPTSLAVPLVDFAYRIVGTGRMGRPHPPCVVGRARTDAVDPRAADQHAALARRGPLRQARQLAGHSRRSRQRGGDAIPRQWRAAASRSCAKTSRWKPRPRAKSRYGTRCASRRRSSSCYLHQREYDPVIRALLDVLHGTWLSAPAATEPA